MKRSAIVITTGQSPNVPHFSQRYYGETLLGRSLIALHKVGIERVLIVVASSEQQAVKGCLEEIAHRIRIPVNTCLQEPGQQLSTVIHAYLDLTTEYVIFQLDQIVHPSLLGPAVLLPCNHDCTLFAFSDVSVVDGQFMGLETIPAKFGVVFKSGGRRLIPSDHENKYSVSSDIFLCLGSRLIEQHYASFDDWIRIQLGGSFHVEFISNAWSLKLQTNTPEADIRSFFWGIAFKEISGEFSKAVNSRLSKPLSFWFSRMQVAPNTISSAQLILYAVASLFLLWPDPWTFIPFAVIWQFAAGVLDRCDGETARIRNYESEDGAKYDVLIDDLRFLIPFAAVTARAWLLHQELNYLLVFGATMAVFLILTSLEIRFMRRKGYLSRQVMGVDYTKSLESGSAWARFFRRFRPFFKGDARTFMISVLSLSLHTLLIFWLFVANIIFMALQGAVLIWQLRSKNTTPTAHNAELVRS